MGQGMDELQFRAWKQNLAPVIYDWFTHHSISWPTQTCRWGPKVEEHSYKAKYRVYFSEQTDDSEPQKLVISSAEVCKPHVASSEVVSEWSDLQKCPYLKEHKVIYHPGEINKVREVPQHPELLVTHADTPELFLWNIDKQPSRHKDKGGRSMPADSVPDMLLVGHTDEAQFPLAISTSAPVIASGGFDKLVLLWNLEDELGALLSGGCGGSAGQAKAPRLEARTRLAGHSNTVEDVVFRPGSSTQLASVGDDHALLMWDTRSGTGPATAVADAHRGEDVHCVDWSLLEEHLLATGAEDGSLRIWDERKLGNANQALAQFKGHSGSIIRLEWHPSAKNILASGGEDKLILVWKLDPATSFTGVNPVEVEGKRSRSAAKEAAAAAKEAAAPKEVIFQHLGHKRGRVVDFQWHPSEPWTMLSVSDDNDDEEVGGGSLQMWRINDIIYRDEAEVLRELEAHRAYILNGRNPPEPKIASAIPLKREDELAGAPGLGGGGPVISAIPPTPAPAAATAAPPTSASNGAGRGTQQAAVITGSPAAVTGSGRKADGHVQLPSPTATGPRAAAAVAAVSAAALTVVQAHAAAPVNGVQAAEEKELVPSPIVEEAGAADLMEVDGAGVAQHALPSSGPGSSAQDPVVPMTSP